MLGVLLIATTDTQLEAAIERYVVIGRRIVSNNVDDAAGLSLDIHLDKLKVPLELERLPHVVIINMLMVLCKDETKHTVIVLEHEASR